MNANTLVAVDPGSREVGCAVFKGTELCYYAVKGISPSATVRAAEAEAARITKDLISQYQPFHFALARRIAIHHDSKRLVHVTRAIRRTALDSGRALYEDAPKRARQFICGNEQATKKETAQKLAARYPELRQYIEGRSRWEELYYERMFGAVALGLTCVLGTGTESQSAAT